MAADHEKVSAMADVPWLNAREQRAWRAFLDVTRELPAELNRQLTRDAGLSGADYALLVPLSEASEGRLRPRDLGRQVDWDRSRLSHQIRRMQERGLVVREECCTDGRGAFIVLTDRGRDAITSAAPDHVRSVRRFFLTSWSPRRSRPSSRFMTECWTVSEMRAATAVWRRTRPEAFLYAAGEQIFGENLGLRVGAGANRVGRAEVPVRSRGGG
jgi:DNA-binding MarR family transcriptional regulator